MTFTFTNHWKHEHIILLGCEWGYKGFELTILNFGFAFKIEKVSIYLTNDQEEM